MRVKGNTVWDVGFAVSGVDVIAVLNTIDEGRVHLKVTYRRQEIMHVFKFGVK